jgi:hypothetical protein
MSQASYLINGLAGERNRWTEDASNLQRSEEALCW